MSARPQMRGPPTPRWSPREERARAAEAQVASLEREVTERRTRSKANLEKMYAARKERDAAQLERDEARAMISAAAAENATLLKSEAERTEGARADAEAARRGSGLGSR